MCYGDGMVKFYYIRLRRNQLDYWATRVQGVWHVLEYRCFANAWESLYAAETARDSIPNALFDRYSVTIEHLPPE